MKNETDSNIYKIGIEVIATENQDVIDYNDQHMIINTGDIGVLNSKGEIYWLTGAGANKVQEIVEVTANFEGHQVEGYDIENIIELISKEISEHDKEKNINAIKKILKIILCDE